MRTYIINLKRSVDRRIYMEGQCRKLPFLNVEYINAVDGRNMSPDERTAAFDEKEFEKRYSVKVRPGEIGCTLSHQKCYKKIVEEHLPYALILEDDISLSVDIKAALEK
ncbi:glycosyltransferase family 25 protein [Bacteroides uniformis]|nr:glycosyltransferase family 25 protein [Bacteroides uniformis]MCY6319736.1 glycosyltransferase family 25 protein [Bacteroides uniformis]